MTRDQEVAWAAGLFEGEGYFSIHNAEGGTYALTAGLGMTDEDVVRRFQDVVGCGTITVRHEAHDHWKTCYVWRLYGRKVADFAEWLLPYLGERRSAKALEVIRIAPEIKLHNSEKTHCPQGHPYDEANTGIGRQRGGAISRTCRTCKRIRAREWHRKRREKIS